MNPLLIALSGAGLLGGFLGGKGRKPLDPRELERLFGPGALAGDTRSLYNLLASSPEMAALINSSYGQGNTLAANLRQNLARSGLGGGMSGIGSVLESAAPTYGRTLHLNALAALWRNALAAAQENLGARMGLFGQSRLAYQGTPTMAQTIGSALTGGASMGLTALAGAAPRSPRAPAAASAFTPDFTPIEDLLPRPVVGSGGTILRRTGWTATPSWGV